MKLKNTQYKILKYIEDNNLKKYILAMDTGTGKTLVGLILLQMYHKPKHKSLIICPKILVNNVWVSEQKYFNIPDTKLIPITSKNIKTPKKNGIYVISYSLFTYHRDKIKKYKWDNVILDESHYIANRGSKRTKSIIGTYTRRGIVNELNCDRMYLLTGTLMPNNEQQIYSQLRAVGFKDTWTKFKDEYFFNPVPTMPFFLKFKEHKREKFNKLISNYTYVVKKDETELKDIKKEFRYIAFGMPDDVGEIQNKLIVNKIYKNKLWKVKLDYNIKKFILFRELASGFINDDKGERHTLSNPRLAMFDEFITNHFINEKMIIWYSFNYDKLVIDALMKDKKRPYWFLNGGLTSRQQETIIEQYKASKNGLLFIQFGVGKVGLTFTETKKMVYYNLIDDNEIFQQSQNRIHRYGQNETCVYYILHMRNSIDDAIIAALKRKNNMIETLKNWLLRRVSDGEQTSN